MRAEEGFRITGPGRYMTRKKVVAVITAPSNRLGYDWGGYVMEERVAFYDWVGNGKFYAHDDALYDYDILARLPDEPPMPDAQDRIVGVEMTPKPIDPLARLEAWLAKDVETRRCEIKASNSKVASKVYLHGDEGLMIGVTTGPLAPTIVDAIDRALDIAERCS